jgi:hypothetical protein
MAVSILSVLGEHLLISLVPWLVGGIAAAGLGTACALAARGLFFAHPGLRSASMVLPWRTVAVTVPVLFPLIPVVLGLGTLAGATMVALFVFLFAVPFTASTLLEHWVPSPLVVRLIGGFRTLATASVAVGAWTSMVAGSGGAGVLIFREGWQLLDYSQVLRGLWVVALLALLADMLLGVLQCLLGRVSAQARGYGEARNPSPDQPQTFLRTDVRETPSSAALTIGPYEAGSIAAKAIFTFDLKSEPALVDRVLRQVRASSTTHEVR